LDVNTLILAFCVAYVIAATFYVFAILPKKRSRQP